MSTWFAVFSAKEERNLYIHAERAEPQRSIREHSLRLLLLPILQTAGEDPRRKGKSDGDLPQMRGKVSG